MTDWLSAAVDDLTGAGRTYSSWLEALHEQAPHAAHGITTEQQARERWAEMAASVLRVTTAPDTVRDTARRLLDAVGVTPHPMSLDDPMSPTGLEEGADGWRDA